MDAETRKTLEALHDAAMTSIPAMNAIRAALAEVDALTQQVATLTTERDEAHRLAVESKRKMDAAYAHADLIQSEMTTATDDCPHPSDTWTTCSACHLKVMRERDAACAQVADLEHADECHAKFYARLCDALHVPEQHAVDGDVFDAIADLEARAIPTEWVAGSEGWHILVDGPDGSVTVHHAEYDPDPATRWQCWTPTHRSGHPTLSAALSAAKEA